MRIFAPAPLRWLTLLLLVGCTTSGSTARRTPLDDELLVAAAALARFVDEDSIGALQLFHTLEGRTAAFSDSAAWTAATDSFGLQRDRYPALVARYWTANRHPRRLTSPLAVPDWTVQLVDRPEPNPSVFETVHYISRVGLGPSGDSALVAIDAICGPLCGHGILALYVRRAGAWTHASTLQSLQY